MACKYKQNGCTEAEPCGPCYLDRERWRTHDGVDLIRDERKRQIEKEGWTERHDDDHADDVLAMAAACYAMPARGRDIQAKGLYGIRRLLEVLWPWDREWWKPTPDDRIRELVKAGALIAAEIDRLKRYIDLNRDDEDETPTVTPKYES